MRRRTAWTVGGFVFAASLWTIGCSSDEQTGDGAGSAVGGQSAGGAAGTAGQPSGGSGGAVVASCNCPGGCCDTGGKCRTVAQMDWDACGTNGSACGKCGVGALCGGGACDETKWSPNARIRMTVTRITIESSACSDPVGAPDPVCTLERSGAVLSSSATCNDTNTCDPQWKVEGLTPGDFTSGTTKLSIDDEDTSFNDPCWSTTLKLSPFVRKSSEYVLPAGSGLVDFRFTLQGY